TVPTLWHHTRPHTQPYSGVPSLMLRRFWLETNASVTLFSIALRYSDWASRLTTASCALISSLCCSICCASGARSPTLFSWSSLVPPSSRRSSHCSGERGASAVAPSATTNLSSDAIARSLAASLSSSVPSSPVSWLARVLASDSWFDASTTRWWLGDS